MQDIYIYLFMGVYYTMCVYIELFVYSVLCTVFTLVVTQNCA